MQPISSLARPLHQRNPSVRVSPFFCVVGVCAALLGPAISTSAATTGEVRHVVIFWLKRPGNAADRAQVARASESFRQLPGVEGVKVGRGAVVRRPGIEESFDLCAIFTFRNQAALKRFQASPEHRRIVEKVLKPLVQRYSVFDSVQD